MALHVLSTIDQLEALLASGSSRPVYLFKHSETCGMSLQAYEEVKQALAEPGFDTDVHLVSVQASRPVSQAIASRLGVVHQSPQLLLVHEGAVRWHTSHLAITVDVMREAVERYAVPTR